MAHSFDTSKAPPFYMPAFPFPDAKKTTMLGRLGEMHQIAREAADEYVAAKRKVKNDTTLSAEGKRRGVQAVAQKLLEQLQRMSDAELPKVYRKIEDLETTLQRAGEADAEDRGVTARRHEKIRRWFFRLDASQRLDTVKGATSGCS